MLNDKGMQILTFEDKLLLYGFDSNAVYIFDKPIITKFDISNSNPFIEMSVFGDSERKIISGSPIINLKIEMQCGKVETRTITEVGSLFSGLKSESKKVVEKIKSLPLELKRSLQF